MSNLNTESEPLSSETVEKSESPSTSARPGVSLMSLQMNDHLLALSQYREALGRCRDDQERTKKVTELYKVTEALVNSASAAGMPTIVRLCAAMNSFLKELCAKEVSINGSNLRTLALALDTLNHLLRQSEPEKEQNRTLTSVVIDDHHISRTAARMALANAGMEPTCFGEAKEAMSFLAKNRTDVVVLDMRFTDLYDRIRELPLHENTPTIFVSSKVDTQFATAMNDCNETQILTKPFNVITYLELALKSYTRVLRRDLGLDNDTTHIIRKPEAVISAPKETPASPAPTPEPVETPAPVAEVPAPDQSRIKQLEEEVAALKKNAQQLTDDLSLEKDVVAELTQIKTDLQNSLREAQALTNGESSEFERRLRESASNCARLTTELEQERAERRRADQRASTLAPQLKALHEQLIQHLGTQSMSQERIDALEKQIREGNESLNKLTSDLDKERSERKLAEEQLHTSGELVAQLRNCLSAFDEAKKGYKRTNDELQARLVSNQNATKELEAKLQKQAGEHQRLEEALAAAQRQLQEQAEQNTFEISRLKSALESEEAEHKRLEVESIQLRYASLDSARSGLANANKFRRQIQEPVDQLIQNMRRLLEVPLEEEPKQLVQSMLENAIFLQGNVQEIGKTYTKSATPEQQPAPEKLAA